LCTKHLALYTRTSPAKVVVGNGWQESMCIFKSLCVCLYVCARVCVSVRVLVTVCRRVHEHAKRQCIVPKHVHSLIHTQAQIHTRKHNTVKGSQQAHSHNLCNSTRALKQHTPLARATRRHLATLGTTSRRWIASTGAGR
jgi:NADH:ubiquinone oxidoreductase subunit